MRKTLFSLLLGLVTTGAIMAPAQAHGEHYSEFGVCCSEQVEVATTPFALVEGAYQGQYKAQGIPGFAVFEQKVAMGQITAEDLVSAAYFEYRATYEDLIGETSFIDEVEQYLEGYTKGRN